MEPCAIAKHFNICISNSYKLQAFILWNLERSLFVSNYPGIRIMPASHQNTELWNIWDRNLTLSSLRCVKQRKNGVVIKNAVVKILVHVFRCTYVHISAEWLLRSGSLVSQGMCTLSTSVNTTSFPKWFSQSSFLPEVYESSKHSISSTTFSAACLFHLINLVGMWHAHF